MSLWVPEKKADGLRRYGQWAGNPAGQKEDLVLCAYEVSNSPGWSMTQCSRKRGHGPGGEFCRQHAKKMDARDQ